MADLNNEFLPECPDCGDATLPIFSDNCFSESTIEESEIQEIFFSEPHATNFGEPKNPITGHTTTGLAANAAVNEAAILAWIAGKDNDGSGTLRSIKGIGDKPATTSTEALGPEGKSVKTAKTHPLNFDVVTLDNLNYAALQKIDACGGEVHLWYRTNKYLYGGLNGVKVNVKGADLVLARGIGSIAAGLIQVDWKAKTGPTRDFWPSETSGS